MTIFRRNISCCFVGYIKMWKLYVQVFKTILKASINIFVYDCARSCYLYNI